MPYLSLGLAAALGLCALGPAEATAANPVVVITTSMGPITVELDQAKAPVTVENFLKYVDSGFYSGLVFHRVIDGFMIQGGGMDAMLNKKETQAPIRNEAKNGLSNRRGTIAMARTGDPNSATAQFYINLEDKNAGNLDPTPGSAGYAVFGKVTAGMEVVDAIAKVDTGTKRGGEGVMPNVPLKPVIIVSVKRQGKA